VGLPLVHIIIRSLISEGKGKVFPVLNKAPRHEDVLGE